MVARTGRARAAQEPTDLQIAWNVAVRNLSAAIAESEAEVSCSPLPVVLAAQPSFKAGTQIVPLYVTVVDDEKRLVPDLGRDDFEVLDNGKPVTLTQFSNEPEAFSVVVMLDTSASMTGSMELVQQAAVRFAKSLRAQDRAAVMGISGGLRVLQAFTGELPAVERAIRSTRPAGKTPFYASVYTALNELMKERRLATSPRRQAIVVLSDGLERGDCRPMQAAVRRLIMRGITRKATPPAIIVAAPTSR